MKRFAILLLLGLPAYSATYHVATNGVDNNPGSPDAPFRTIQKGANVARAGDTVLVAPGSYEEYVRTTASGTPEARITFRALPTNVPNQQVVLKQFRVQHPHNTIEGFNLTGAQNSLAAHIRIEPNANHTLVTNCTIRDAVYFIGEVELDSRNSSLHAPGADWASRGFEVGGRIYLGGCSLEPYVYVNHDTGWTIKSITGDSLQVTGTFAAEPTNPVWMPVYAGLNRNGMTGVDFIVSGGVSATNCTIVDSTFTNIWGHAIRLLGYNHTVAGNTFTELHSYAGMRVSGGGHVIHDNFWYNCTNFIFYSAYEVSQIPHPPGSGWYDYVVGFIHSTAATTPTGTNVHFFHNWIQNSHNPVGQISEAVSGPDYYYGFYIRSNVFVGMPSGLSGGRNGLTVENNTFYRIAFDEGLAHAVTVGGNSAEAPATNIFVRKNVFVDVGSHRSLDNEGFYGLVNGYESEGDYNFVAGPETTGWQEKRSFTDPNGINGGDPLFQDLSNPLGPDGRPFTADDGLKPLPGSPIALNSLGALSPVQVESGKPIAYFTITSLSSGFGWHDKTGIDFDPAWETLAPFMRTNKVRPWNTPEALGEAPATVTFSAENSISAISDASTNWIGITQFLWDFGDGTTVSSTEPSQIHTYQWPGSYFITLTITNNEGHTHSTRKTFRVLGDGVAPPMRPSPPNRLRVVGAAAP